MDEVHRHRRDGQAIEHRIGASDGVIDEQGLLGLGDPVIHGADIDRLAAPPSRCAGRCGGVELQDQRLRKRDAIG